MVSRVIPVDPFDLVVFGGTGDLARRKILPALFRRFSAGQMEEGARIIGAARTEMDDAGYRAYVHEALTEFVTDSRCTPDTIAAFLENIFYVTLDARGDQGWDTLARMTMDGPDRVRAYYFSVAPSLFGRGAEEAGGGGQVERPTEIRCGDEGARGRFDGQLELGGIDRRGPCVEHHYHRCAAGTRFDLHHVWFPASGRGPPVHPAEVVTRYVGPQAHEVGVGFERGPWCCGPFVIPRVQHLLFQQPGDPVDPRTDGQDGLQGFLSAAPPDAERVTSDDLERAEGDHPPVRGVELHPNLGDLARLECPDREPARARSAEGAREGRR